MLAVIAFLAGASMTPGPDMRDVALRVPSNGVFALDPMPFTSTVTCSTYTVTGSAPIEPTWSASPSGASGACTGSDSFSCVVDVNPANVGEGVEVITITSGVQTKTVTIGFYVDGSHSCFLAQNINGTYNSGMTNADAVATWENLGSSALDVTQGVGSAQPSYRTAVVGGQPVVRCDGGDRVEASTASDWTFLHNGTDSSTEHVSATTAANPNALMFVLATTSGIGGAPVGMTTAYDDRTASVRNDRQQATIARVGAFALALNSPADNRMPAQKFNLSTLTIDDDGAGGNDGFYYANGALDVAGAQSGGYSAAAPTGPINICSGVGGASSFTGDLFRVLIYQSALTATQRGINKAVDEWALGGTLPVTP